MKSWEKRKNQTVSVILSASFNFDENLVRFWRRNRDSFQFKFSVSSGDNTLHSFWYIYHADRFESRYGLGMIVREGKIVKMTVSWQGL